MRLDTLVILEVGRSCVLGSLIVYSMWTVSVSRFMWLACICIRSFLKDKAPRVALDESWINVIISYEITVFF